MRTWVQIPNAYVKMPGGIMSVTPMFTRTEVSGVWGLTGQQACQIWEPPSSVRDPLLINKVECDQERHPIVTTDLRTHVYANQQKPTKPTRSKNRKNWRKAKEIALLNLVLSQTEH